MITKSTYIKRYGGGINVDQITDYKLFGFILLYRTKVEL